MSNKTRIGRIVQQLYKSKVAQNAAALYGTQIATYMFPLAMIPYLARVLGPRYWGIVAMAQALGLYFFLVMDFGFQLSATRKVARLRNDRESLRRTVAGVIGAKLLLGIVCLCALAFIERFVPTFHQHRLICWVGGLSGIGMGFNMLWFYQGLERMRTPALLDVVGKAISAAGVFLFVHRPEDAWKVLALQCISYSGIALILLAMVYREIGFLWPRLNSAWQALRESAALFLLQGAVSLYTTANALILAGVAGPSAVGYYSGAEKISKATITLLNPISQSLYPRLSHLVMSDYDKALRLTRISMAIMTTIGLSLGSCLFVGAPAIIHIALGHGYEPAVSVLRVLSIMVPAIAISNVLAIQYMLPMGMETTVNKIVISAGALNLVLAFWWASRWKQLGMAWAVVISEVTVTLLMCIVLIRKPVHPSADNQVVPVPTP